MKFGIGIDLGGTQIKGAAFDLETGEVLARDTRPTRAGEQDGDLPAFAVETRTLIGGLEGALPEKPGVLGIAAPGLADPDGKCIRIMPGRLTALENFMWTDFLGRNPVPVLNDAHAAIMGEIWQGAAMGKEDVVLLTLGTGLGGAIVSGGKLLRGHIGRAGHLGHMTVDFRGAPDICNTPGSIEDAIGNHTIGARSEGKYETTHALIAAYETGDPQATEIWLRSVRALAAAIASLVNIVDPECIVIGGGIAKAGEALFAPLRKDLDSLEWRPGGHAVEVVPAELGEWAGTYGAVHHGRMKAEG